MSTVYTRIGSGQHVGNTIDDALLGINMRTHHNRTKEGSEFRQVMEQIGTNALRYPGGTITEEHFDITNPNEKKQVNVMHLIHPELIPERSNGVAVVRTTTPLNEYLDYVDELDGDPILVLPTYRFFDQTTRGLTANALADISVFMHELMLRQHGDFENITIEIGNEYFQDRFSWTEQEFSWIQAAIARIVDNHLDAMGLRHEVTLLAQGGHVRNNNVALTNDSNQVLASAISYLDPGTVDGITLHLYGTNDGSTNPLAMAPNITHVMAGAHAAWAPVLGAGFEVSVSEWNVGEDGADNTGVNGLMRTAPLLDMFAQMVRNGVDSAQIFAARVDGPAGLAMRSEPGGELTPTGHFFDMLAESTEGLNLVDTGAAFRMHNAQNQHVGYNYTFEGQEGGHHRSVTYFASGIGQTLALTADMTAQIRDGAYVYARTLDVAPGDAVNDYYADAVVNYSTDVRLVANASGGVSYQAELKAYQMIELHVVYGQGVNIEGGQRIKRADNLTGSAFDDEIRGYGGHDNLRGEGGDDMLDGGFGKDVLYGDGGTDMMLGGSGSDRLVGGLGDDELHGGRGHDQLLGNSDNDLLWGEAGFDRLFGDDGDDVLFGGRGRDELYGGTGADQLRGDGGIDFVQGDAGNDSVFGGAGHDVLHGGADDDQLFGGMGSDRLEGGTGNDVLHGGAGRDAFVFADDGGMDRVLDFRARKDFIDVSAFGFADAQTIFSYATDTADGVVIDFDGGESMTLVDVMKETLSVDHFIL